MVGTLRRLLQGGRLVQASRPRGSPPICRASEEEPAWKAELAELNVAVRESAGEELPADEHDPAATYTLQKERVFLVGVQLKAALKDGNRFSVDESLRELERLATSAGLEVVGSTSQQLDRPNAASYIGSGKVAEITTATKALAVNTIIFDDELTPGQQRNIEKSLGEAVRVADRTALILDIFEQRARSREGRLQVELAAASYELPRLKRMWTHLERQMGSGAMRAGMGEKQKEIDKRLLRDKMTLLRKEIEDVRQQRRAHRQRRKAASMPVVALVGYTNAGKSTLINALTAADVHAEDALFATLDPTTRRAALPTGTEVLVSDTVGFVQKLPTQLVAAFRATLEEIEEADVLLHVVDASHRDAAKQLAAVFRVLKEIDVSDDIPMVTVWNKIDACDDPAAVAARAAERPGTVAVSAATGANLDELRGAIEDAMEDAMVPFEACVPYTDGGALAALREHGVLRSEVYKEDGVHVAASAGPALLGRLRNYVSEYVPRERVYSWRYEEDPEEAGGEEGVAVEADGGDSNASTASDDSAQANSDAELVST